ncbi:MAG: cell division protein FtsA [Acidobacteriota bacterium]|nr:cell division protein FtsA [Acidobacteriota bacterium]
MVGIGASRTEGIRKGVIINLEALVNTIKTAVEQAEAMASRSVEAALVSVPAAQARSFSSRGVVTIQNRDKVVSRKDLQRVLETVRAVQIPDGQAILHALPQEYTLDGQDEIQDPVGMTGTRLEASAHLVTIPQQAAQHVVSALNHAGIEVVSLVYPQLASAEAVLSPEEREQGVFLIDCGGGTTDVALFEKGALWFTASVPVAGDLITNDISIGLRAPVPDAEDVKRRYARAAPGGDDDMVFEVATVCDNPPRLVTVDLLTRIVGPRVQEIFELVRECIDKAALRGRAPAGAVLVGGSANLAGLPDVAEEVLGLPVRVGLPREVGGLVEEIRSPGMAVPVGLAVWEIRRGRRERARELTRSTSPRLFKRPLELMQRGLGWFGEMF